MKRSVDQDTRGHKGLSCKTPPQKKRRNDITAGQLEAAADPARKMREEGKMSKVLYCVNKLRKSNVLDMHGPDSRFACSA
jgi:hypothetical protein